MAGGYDAGVGACGADGLELSLRLGSPPAASAPAPARRNLAIVYDKRVLCAVDVVELQAMAIISMANRETTGKITDMDVDAGTTWRSVRAPTRASPDHGGIVAPAPALLGDQGGLSMKRSLQRFLEKRKARAAATASPYAVRRPARMPRS